MTYTRNRRVGFNVGEWILTLSEREKALLRKEAKFYCLEELLYVFDLLSAIHSIHKIICLIQIVSSRLILVRVPEDGNILEKDWWVHVH